MKNLLKTGLAFVFGLIVFVMFWGFALRLKLVSPAALASPLEVASSLPELIAPSGNLGDILSTVSRSLLAFVLSVPIGVGIGCLLFFSGPMRESASFIIDFLRSI